MNAFLLNDIKRKRLAKQVWVPLRLWKQTREGQYGHLAYVEDLSAVRTVAIRFDFREHGEKISWNDSLDGNGCYASNDIYVPSDVYQFDTGVDSGIYLCLTQNSGGLEEERWYLHQDIEIAFGLKREGNLWLCPQEGYEVAAKYETDCEGGPEALLIKASYLSEYLFLRKMSLRITSYHSKTAVFDEGSGVGWSKAVSVMEHDGRFEGREWFIHPGGHPYGSKTAVFHMSRNDEIFDEDVPELGPETADNVVGNSWQAGGDDGERLLMIQGEFWRNEWFEAGLNSPIIAYPHLPSSTSYFVESAGGKMSADELNNEDIGRWLWFRPSLVHDLLSKRNTELTWHTRDTFTIKQNGFHIHMGINSASLLNAYAYDIARLREWQRLICQGHNIPPDGKVATELLDAQVRARPASTQAPESMLKTVMVRLEQFFQQREGINLFIEHAAYDEVVSSINRFRSVDRASLLSVAKDLARVFIDRLDTKAIQKSCKTIIPEKTGSLKSFQKYIEQFVGTDEAHRIFGPLFGLYELRLADAHLPSSKYADFYNLAGVKLEDDYLRQGLSILTVFMDTIWSIGNIIESALQPAQSV